MWSAEILSWLSTAPQLNGELLNLNYLPSYSGWSVAVVKAGVRTDILGNRSTVQRLKVTRRTTVPDSAARLAVFDLLEELAAWAKENPPPVGAVRITGLPEFSSRASSGTEDFSVTFTLVSDE